MAADTAAAIEQLTGMGKPNVRFVARAAPGTGWRIWDRMIRRWWANPFAEYLEALLAELNGAKRPERIVELTRRRMRKRG